MLDTTKWGKAFQEAQWSPPLGIASLAAMAKQKGFSVCAADLYYATEQQVYEVLEADEYSVIGISCFSDQRTSSFRLARFAKEVQPRTVIVLGGPHPTFMYEQILENLPIDAVVVGEGELALIDLLSAVNSHANFHKIPGVVFRQNGNVIVNPMHSLLEDLDLLPDPDLSHFQQCEYAPRSWLINTKIAELADFHFASVIGSRGCIWNCLFCSTPRAWGRKWRSRSPERIASEIHNLYQTYGYRYIDFADDIFTLNVDWTYALCKQLIDLELPVKWSCSTRADCVDIQLLQAMIKAGCVLVSFGVESGSQHIRDKINKRLSIQAIRAAFASAKNVGLVTDMMLMVGNPGETQESINETLRLIDDIQPDLISTDITTILPGTELYDFAVREEVINDKFWLAEEPAPYFTLEHSKTTLMSWLNEINQKKGWTIEHVKS
jgi:radical SAM superfamily enzyme YgiQ (UPF0313 family)